MQLQAMEKVDVKEALEHCAYQLRNTVCWISCADCVDIV